MSAAEGLNIFEGCLDFALGGSVLWRAGAQASASMDGANLFHVQQP